MKAEPKPVPVPYALGTKQLAIYLVEKGIDPKSIPPAATKEIIATALATIELTSLRSSQAMVTYMSLLKAYSAVIADYCTKAAAQRKASDPVICEILKTHGVPPASK